ncbi:MAG TPA: putative porin [Terriglobales bacterium]|nr:putative porin [Terriglobales bacterium]
MRSRRNIGMVLAVASLAATVSAQTSTASKPKKSSAGAPVTAKDLQELRDALAAQQQQIQELREEMRARETALEQAQQQAQQAQQQLQQAQSSAGDAEQKAANAQAAADAQQATVAKLSSDLADVKTSLVNSATVTKDEATRLSALENFASRFRFDGDIRVRGESSIQDNIQDRNRARVRVRFGFDGKLNEDFIGGVAIATGSLGDPTTTNETLSGFFDRKTIGLDKAFITYNPVRHGWFSATGGKFAYLWQRTSVTGDPDLNPEGFDVKLSFNSSNPLVKNFTVQAINYLFNEVSSGTDSYAVGGQASSRLQAGPWSATASYTALKWQGTSALLQASAFNVEAPTTGSSGTTPAGPFPAPGEGPGCAKGSAGSTALPTYAPCAFAANGMTNAVITDASGKPRFLSGFFYNDFILNNQFKTGLERFPVNLLLEFEDNLDAASHPLDTKGNIISSLGPQGKEYGVDFSFGQVRNKNDVQLGYAWLRQEQDSVLASFAESDQRAPTNILQNRLYALWKLRSNTLASLTWWHGRTLNTGLQNNAALAAKSITSAGQKEPYLNRLQFDLIYTF